MRTWNTRASNSVAGTDAPIPRQAVGPHFGPHDIVLHPLQALQLDLLYLQNHCGIYRLERQRDAWERIGRSLSVGIYSGTTRGEVRGSLDEGGNWTCLRFRGVE